MHPKLWITLLAFALFFKACTPGRSAVPAPRTRDPRTTAQPGQDPYAPVASDEAMKRGDVKIDSIAILATESYPHQYQLEVVGSLPTPCHQLRAVVEEPNVESDIHVQIYSIYDPHTVCIQVQNPFDARLPLGEYVRGSYTITVNDRKVGEIIP